MTTEKINLLNYDLEGLKTLFTEWGEKPYRASQLMQWVHHYGINDFDKMTNLSKALREKLKEKSEVGLSPIELCQTSRDGTIKWLFNVGNGNCIETVYIPDTDRGTLCISSQVGCGLNCSFCSTGQQGFNRNLSAAEILSQIWIAVRHLSQADGRHDRKITNIVFMGMGEPLLNLPAVLTSINVLRSDHAYSFSKYRITVSTSGVLPAMEKLRQATDTALAVSLHAPNDELRNVLVPLNKKYPIKALMQTCRDYFRAQPRRKVMFEYVMLDGVNDTPTHAKELVGILKNVPCKVNLIPFNPFPKTVYQCSSEEKMLRFQRILMDAGIVTLTRRTRGDDIDAACGQLAGEVQDKTSRSKSGLIAKRAQAHLASIKTVVE